MKHVYSLLALGMLLAASSAALAGPAYTDPAEADEDFAYQGEYAGQVKGGKYDKLGVQVIAQGKGTFNAVVYPGGLPGDGFDGSEKDSRIKFTGGERKGETVTFKSEPAGTLKIAGGKLHTAGEVLGSGMLQRVERKSPTIGAKPPKGAVVLFDGTSVEKFKPGAKMTADGLLEQGVTSIPTFGDHTLHVEFKLPYQPEDRGQGRGNSGLYLQGRYEVQMLDSFGLEGENNECGGIYTVKVPDVNMCLPPLSWQTYDVDFTAAKYKDGKKVENARMTVKHNGVVIHENVEVPGPTRAAPVNEGAEPGPVYLQNHGNPVRYRNIWVVEKQ